MNGLGATEADRLHGKYASPAEPEDIVCPEVESSDLLGRLSLLLELELFFFHLPRPGRSSESGRRDHEASERESPRCSKSQVQHGWG